MRKRGEKARMKGDWTGERRADERADSWQIECATKTHMDFLSIFAMELSSYIHPDLQIVIESPGFVIACGVLLCASALNVRVGARKSEDSRRI